MLEVEMKFPDADFAALEDRLRGWGAKAGPAVAMADHYLNAPDRDFARTDEALRLRRVGPRNWVTYKGPKLDAQTKTRVEKEVALPDGEGAAEDFLRLLTHLGYRPVAVVRKRRQTFELEREGFHLEVGLDDVDGLGRFAEVEIQAPENRLDEARAVLQRVAAELGLARSERRSYLEMLLGRAHAAAGTARTTVATTADEVRRPVLAARRAGLTVGLVPTMGALHAGHASLIRQARAENGFVVVSLFVNPTQFGPAEDFGQYPRPREQDLRLCADEKVDLVFAPEPAAMYPPGYATFVEVTGLQDVLCGASRPGHFRGVATVVLKLFNIVQPDAAYFGQKDAQQCRIIQRLVEDLDVPVRVRVCPTVREPDGLALSSRNQYLDAEQRGHATVLFRALEAARALVGRGERDGEAVRRAMAGLVESTPGARLDYAAVVDAESLQPLKQLRGTVLAALAVRFGATRLIDNAILCVPDDY